MKLPALRRTKKLPHYSIPNSERLAIAADTNSATITMKVHYGSVLYSVESPTTQGNLEVTAVLLQELASIGIYCTVTTTSVSSTLEAHHG